MAALDAAGIGAEPIVWDAPPTGLNHLDGLIVRSTWNYHLSVVRFLDWLGAFPAATQVWNPLPLIRWNSDKRYLLELADRGLAVVPTEYLAPDSPESLRAVLDRRHWDRVVLKPAVGASAYLAKVVDRGDLAAGQDHLRAIQAHSGALVQPFLEEVARQGEQSLIFLAGEYSHAIHYRLPFDHGLELRHADPFDPTDDAINLARRVVSVLRPEPIYARIDLVPGPDGAPLLGEAELIEPDLFLRHHPRAPERLAGAIRARLGALPGGAAA
ncbi:MAG TPA: hypothetical protein VFF67_01335 [Thermoplasmata archaeon]|nr:hypothetical protein [Thermoplasmata archaeon]